MMSKSEHITVHKAVTTICMDDVAQTRGAQNLDGC
jgi:hypothetical protein